MTETSTVAKFPQLTSKALLEVQISVSKAVLSLKVHCSYYAPEYLQTLYRSRNQILRSLRDDYPLLGIFFLLIASLAIYFAILWAKKTKTSTPKNREPRLSALAGFIVPVYSSRFDSRFISFAPNGWDMDLASFLEEVYSGTIAFRNPMLLQELFRDQLKSRRRSSGGIFPYSGMQWKKRVLKWVYHSYVTRETSFPMRLVQENERQTLFLDFSPQQDIEAIILKFLGLLCAGDAEIVFTACNPSVRFMSESFLFSAVPYVTANRTATPLFCSLDHVISYINRVSEVKILSVTNVSDKHAAELYEAENDLVETTITRNRFLEQHGERSWRENRLKMVWEAGLHASGVLNRWVVVVKK
ncbi:hypothetical protein L218DRAFT_1075783 [Marasmius fiardii PR-910]|nr:hypothetical protein L218DRAFT_1075783 [Marasmius fiardii PR-910]